MIYLLLLIFVQSNPDDIANKAAADFQEKRNVDLFVSDATYYEIANCSGRVCMFTEGYGYLISFGKHSPIELNQRVFLLENMRKSDRRPEWLDLTQNFTDEIARIKFQSDIPPGYTNALNAIARFEMNGPLARPNQFRYTIVDDVDSDEIHIAFSPRRGRNPYEGILILDRDSQVIKRVELKRTSYYSNWVFDNVLATGVITYQFENNRYAVRSAEFQITTPDVDVEVVLHSGIPRNPGNAVQVEDFDVLMGNDRNPYVIYNEQKWTSTEFYTRIDYERIQNELGFDIGLIEQFKKNADQPFLYRIDPDGERLGVTGGESTYYRVNTILNKLK
ncbi:MAG: hypothetical protein LAT57_09175 [Balneolales bacterium]|nr:hypothetical protein [Balneolales bacterium]